MSAPFESTLLEGVTWELYETVLESFVEERLPHTYLDGRFEVTSLAFGHQWLKRLIGRIIEQASSELQVPIACSGSLTLRRESKRAGLEPDESYYTAHASAVRGLTDIDLERDPPPDLVVQVDIASAPIDRRGVLAKLEVNEVWHFDGAQLRFLKRVSDAGYTPIATSLAFPPLRSADLQRFLDLAETKHEYDIMQEYVTWLRNAKRA